MSGGEIAGFSSVAALRGRRRNVVYAAAKRGLESVFESLRHAGADDHVRVHLFRLGYIENQQTRGLPLPFPLAKPAAVARFVYRRLAGAGGRHTYPAFWVLVGWLLARVPWFLFRRLRF